ncbi:nodulin MtN21 /EamA-like transporter family protein [Tanacetum coccineum]
MEPINIRSLRTIAKFLGTVVCVTSAAAMTLVKGPKLLNAQLPSANSLLSNLPESDNRWCQLLETILTTYLYQPECVFLGRYNVEWLHCLRIHTWNPGKLTLFFSLELSLYAGIVGSRISIFAQAWVIKRRSPVFPTIMIGALGIITGLYVILWGKAKDVKELKEEQAKQSLISQNDQIKTVQVVVNGSKLIEPFLPKENNTL